MGGLERSNDNFGHRGLAARIAFFRIIVPITRIAFSNVSAASPSENEPLLFANRVRHSDSIALVDRAAVPQIENTHLRE
jgi:hypothetical protein